LKPEQFPDDIRPHLIPKPEGEMVYRCLECGAEFDITQLLYTCPHCRGLFMLEDKNEARLKKFSGAFWRRLFDYRRMLNLPALSGIFRFYELIAPVIPLKDIIYLGEGDTPQVAANADLQAEVGAPFYFKNDGQNPSASFKDRGMAAALSYLNFLANQAGAGKLLAICASTGDTSAAAALYSAYLGEKVASAVLLPHGKVTPQQLAQPLGCGAKVLEVPGVFDDCMKVVEALADTYQVALLNSKNSWRIRGQESYAYEIAQSFDYDLTEKTVVMPIGNAGNITAYWMGFKEYVAAGVGVVENCGCGGAGPYLPRMLGIQAEGAAPLVNGGEVADPHTVGTAIKIGRPATRGGAIGAARESGGGFWSITDDQMLEAYRLLASLEGVFAEPASCSSVAGLIKISRAGYFDGSAAGAMIDGGVAPAPAHRPFTGRGYRPKVVAVLTGHGLKDPDTAIRVCEPPAKIAAEYGRLERLVLGQ